MSTIEEALARRYPEGVVLISSISRDGKANVMPAGWSMRTADQPLLLAVSVGCARYTHELILETGEFVLAYPSLSMIDDVKLTGSKSGRDTEKMSACRLRLIPAEKIRARLVEGAVANFECVLRSHHRTGDHTIFVGEVLAARVDGPPGSRLMNFGSRRFGLAAMPDAEGNPAGGRDA